MFGDKKMGQKQNYWLTCPAKKQTLEFKTSIDVLAYSNENYYEVPLLYSFRGEGRGRRGGPQCKSEMLKQLDWETLELRRRKARLV